MGGGAAGGLLRHQHGAILDFVKNYKQVKTVRIHHFLRLTCKITQK